MPTYKLKCSDKECDWRSSVLQKMSAPLPPCGKCGKETEKLPARSGFNLVGGGWFGDGYRSPK